jgi:topoisomerase-4 subunit A
MDGGNSEDNIHEVVPVSGLYENWFLEYASYVILERAVPAINDGLKPVQRRILHAMKELDDGRYNKVANIIGSAMQFHPHGDASISDAIVNMGQKDLLIDTQGNWGDVRTGDGAAAPRYIEARLSKLAQDILFNDQTTEWQASYDGRKKEPINLPAKFPLLLAQGVEGIAVGLSTKILPHNFCELIEACIACLRNKKFELYPDFQTGGFVDVNAYNQGQKGSKVRVRARIEEMDKKTLAIRDIPFGVTTTALIDSILKANDQGKIKIKKVIDNTAKDVEIQIQLAPGTDPDVTIDALYAFSDCEVSISPNACVILDEKPVFLSVHDILRYSAEQTKVLLGKELDIKRKHLLERLLFSSLEKIFIENRIYRKIEECETWEEVIKTIDKGLTPFKKDFYRVITEEDIVRLTEIKIKRISKFDAFKADELMRNLQEELKQTEEYLANLTDYAVDFFKDLLKKYGKGRERKTIIKQFDTINITAVALNNQKLYVNRAEGFIGYGLKKDELVCDCSDLDDIIVFRKDGVCTVKKIGEKIFAGKDIIHIAVFRKGDERMVYHMAYLDGTTGAAMVKRFQVLGVTRDKEYDLTKGAKGSKVLYLSANPNGEQETVTVTLTPTAKAKIKVFDYDFSEMEIKARTVNGNILTKYPIKKIAFKSSGASTLAGVELWFDPETGRLNKEAKGQNLGVFEGEQESILALYKNGTYEITSSELTNRYDTNLLLEIKKFDPEVILTALYMETESKTSYIKRFKIETSTLGKAFSFLPENKETKLFYAGSEPALLQIQFSKGKYVSQPEIEINPETYAEIKSMKTLGNRISNNNIQSVKVLAKVVKGGSKAEKAKNDAPPGLFD